MPLLANNVLAHPPAHHHSCLPSTSLPIPIPQTEHYALSVGSPQMYLWMHSDGQGHAGSASESESLDTVPSESEYESLPGEDSQGSQGDFQRQAQRDSQGKIIISAEDV